MLKTSRIGRLGGVPPARARASARDDADLEQRCRTSTQELWFGALGRTIRLQELIAARERTSKRHAGLALGAP